MVGDGGGDARMMLLVLLVAGDKKAAADEIKRATRAKRIFWSEEGMVLSCLRCIVL